MSITERCRAALKRLEVNLRDEIKEHEHPSQLSFADILLLGGKKPTPLAEVELLDAVASYFNLKCEDDVRFRVFCELFPLESECHAYQLEFLVKLSSLALSIGLPPLLDFVALWLKIRIAQIFGFSMQHPSDSDPSIPYQVVTTFIVALTRDLLNIQESPELASKPDGSGHPFSSLPSHSPVFCDAYFSGLLITFGFSPSIVSSLFPEPALKPVGPPPSSVVCVLTQWMQFVRLQHKSHHPYINWTSVDWTMVLRRYTLSSFSHSSAIEQVVSSIPSVPVLLAWWTVFSPICATSGQLKKYIFQNEESNLFNALSELHHELLQCLLETNLTIANGGHRHNVSGASSVSSSFANWYVPCKRKLDQTKDFKCLEQLVKRVTEIYLNVRESTDVDDAELMILRLAEFLQISWASGRLRNLSSDEFVKLFSSLSHHKLFDLMRVRLRR